MTRLCFCRISLIRFRACKTPARDRLIASHEVGEAILYKKLDFYRIEFLYLPSSFLSILPPQTPIAMNIKQFIDLSNNFRGWKRNNWISLIQYSFHFFPSYSLFIIKFCLIFIIPYSSLSSSFSCITVVFKIGQSHPMLLRILKDEPLLL